MQAAENIQAAKDESRSAGSEALIENLIEPANESPGKHLRVVRPVDRPDFSSKNNLVQQKKKWFTWLRVFFVFGLAVSGFLIGTLAGGWLFSDSKTYGINEALSMFNSKPAQEIGAGSQERTPEN